MNIQEIKFDYENGEISYLDAIELLQEYEGYSSLEAEEIVCKWENTNDK